MSEYESAQSIILDMSNVMANKKVEAAITEHVDFWNLASRTWSHVKSQFTHRLIMNGAF